MKKINFHFLIAICIVLLIIYFGKVSFYDDDPLNVQCHADTYKKTPNFSSLNWDADPTLFTDASDWVKANGRISESDSCDKGEIMSGASGACGTALCIPWRPVPPELNKLMKRVMALPKSQQTPP